MEENNIDHGLSEPKQPEQSKKIMRTCPRCGQMREIKSPYKELFRMPTFQEWITLAIIGLLLLAAWAYKHDTQVCRDFVKNIDDVCLNRFAKNSSILSDSLEINKSWWNGSWEKTVLANTSNDNNPVR